MGRAWLGSSCLESPHSGNWAVAGSGVGGEKRELELGPAGSSLLMSSQLLCLDHLKFLRSSHPKYPDCLCRFSMSVSELWLEAESPSVTQLWKSHGVISITLWSTGQEVWPRIKGRSRSHLVIVTCQQVCRHVLKPPRIMGSPQIVRQVLWSELYLSRLSFVTSYL